MASLQSSLVNGTLQISTAVSIDPASYANSVVVGNVGDSSWRAKGIGGSAATNHNWTIGHNGSNLYFGISNGSSASLNTWLQVAPGRTIILPAYTSNGFLKTSNSDGSITVDTATYATQSWVTSQGYLTSGSFLPLSGGTMTGDLVIKNTGTSNDIRIFTNDDDSWIDQRKPDGTVVGRLGFNGYSTSTAYYTDFQIYTRGSADSGLVSRMLIGQDRVLSLQNLTGFNYNGVAVLHASNYNSYSPTLTGGNASGTWGIRITGFANQGTARLYSTDSAYNYDAANPYFGYLTYDGTYWQFKVSPATPANVRVYTADTLEGYSRNQTGGANTIVQRDSNGYNSTAVASFLGLGSMAYQNTGSYYTTSNSIYTNSGSFTTAGTGWYRVATTGSDGRGTYYVEVYTTGGNHNPSYLKILAHGDWGNDKLVTVETDGGFPASAVRITRGASNTFLEVYFTTTILGASLRVNRLGFDSSVQIYTGALPSGGDTLKDQLPVDSKFITQSISATSRIYVGNGGETLGLIGMGASNLYGLGISGAYTSLYGHFQGNGVQLGYYNGSSFTPRLIVNNGGDIVLTSGTSGTTGKLIFKTTDNSDLNKYIMQDGYWTIIGTHSNEGLRVRDSGGNILINIAGSTNGYPSRVGIGTTTPSYKLHVAGDIYADGGWLRVSGTSGLYFESYGGGFRMTGSSYVEMYGSKSLNMNGGSVDYVGSMYLESGGQGVHLQPNTSGSYGALQITSSRNGWPGIYFTVAGTSLMVNSNESGFYRQGYGWQMRWENGTGYVHKNGQGGGTSATILDTSNYTTWAQPKVYMGQSDGNWQNFTNDVGEFRVDEVLNITSGAHSNYPPNVYTYGGVLSWRLNNHSFQLYASHTGDLTFKTQWGNDNYSGWRRILHESNYNSWVPTLTGGGASGTWGISVTGNAATATTATNATNLYGAGGSYIQSTSSGTSYTANYQVRENSGGGSNTNEIYAPQLAFHWSGVVASSIMMESSGRIAIRNNPGSGYESFIAYDVYGSNSMRAPQFRFTNSSNNAYLTGNSDWGFRVVNDNGYIQFGPANGSWSHIYSDKSFYFNQELYINGTQVVKNTGTWGISITGNAATATTASGVAWSNVSSKPAGWLNTTNLIDDYAPQGTAVPSGFYQNYNGSGNPTGTWFNYINVRHSNPANGHGFQIGMSYYDSNLWFRSYQGGTSPTFASWSRALGTQTDPYPSNMNQYVRTTDTVSFGKLDVNFSGSAVNGIGATHTGSISSGQTAQAFSAGWSAYGASFLIAYKQGELSPSDMCHIYNIGGFYMKIYDGSTNRFHRWDDNGSVSINSSSQGSYIFNVTGDIYATADVIAFSDARVKEDVRTVENALDKVTKLRGVTYIKKDEENKKRKMGVIAQEVLEVLPEVVHEDNDGYYGVSYGNIVGVLIEAIKEQQKQIDELKQELKNK